MARIRIVADCVALPCQVTRMIKRVTTFEITAISAIIFIGMRLLLILSNQGFGFQLHYLIMKTSTVVNPGQSGPVLIPPTAYILPSIMLVV